MHKIVYLSLGSNIGDRAANLKDAIARLGGLGEVVAVSSFYGTSRWNYGAAVVNPECAVKLDTESMPSNCWRAFSILSSRWDGGVGASRKKVRGLSISIFFCSEIL